MEGQGIQDTGQDDENQTIVLTSEGGELYDRLVEALREGLKELLAGWSAKQKHELADLLIRLSIE